MNNNTFKKGIILGGLLAAAGAVIGLAATRTGKDLSKELEGDLKTIAKKLKKKLSDLQDITQEKYEELVETITDEYAKKKSLAGKSKDELIAALKMKWREMEQEYRDEKSGTDDE